MNTDLFENDIANSIRYASRIQSAILPGKEKFFRILKDSFILYLPKDIVSGDFYWIKQKGCRIAVTAADCTGHGVPGAFMSIMGINFLNQLTSSEIPKSNKILNQLREYVMKALHQHGDESDQKDGIDMALCVIDKEKKILEFSGANNPLIYFKGSELIQLKGDRMPIGVGPVTEEAFSYHELALKKIDHLYIFSDGYQDQFGGENGKKLKSQGLRKILVEIQNNPFSEHENLLYQKLLDWRGNNEQVDDILITGINIKKLLHET